MICLNCEYTLPDSANYCLNCGLPQRIDFTHSLSDARFEMCEVRAVFAKKENSWKYRLFLEFIAIANGPHGRYDALKSKAVDSDFRGDQVIGAEVVLVQSERRRDAKVKETFSIFVTELQEQGWEQLGQGGEYWYNQRFRRRIV